MISRYTHLIWDFNGTILDDVDFGMACVNEMLQKRGLAVIPDREHYRKIMRFPIIDYYRDVGFDLEAEDYYTVLAPEWVALYCEGERNCAMMPGVLQVLQDLHKRGVPQIILSASNRSQLMSQLERLGITSYFDEILGLDDFYAKSKMVLAEDFMRRHPDAVPLWVGDTDHDGELATHIGADCLLYTGGHQSRERLASCGHDLIDRIEDLSGFFF